MNLKTAIETFIEKDEEMKNFVHSQKYLERQYKIHLNQGLQDNQYKSEDAELIYQAYRKMTLYNESWKTLNEKNKESKEVIQDYLSVLNNKPISYFYKNENIRRNYILALDNNNELVCNFSDSISHL